MHQKFFQFESAQIDFVRAFKIPHRNRKLRKSRSNIGVRGTEHFQRAIHACGSDEGGVLAEADACCERGVIVEDLQLLPLLAQVNSEAK